METAQRFTFDTSFDEEGKNQSASSDPESVRALADEAYARGRAEALAEVQSTHEQRTLALLESVRQALALIQESGAAAYEGARREALDVALAVARKALPGLERRDAMKEIELLVSDCLDLAIKEPRVVVRVADAMLDALQDHIDTLQTRAGFEGKVVLIAQDGLGPTDCQVEWADGGAQRDMKQIWSEIDTAISRALNVAAADLTLGGGPSNPTGIVPSVETPQPPVTES